MTSRLREYVASFRIKELSQSLEQLGLSKRGRKLELQNRLLTYLGDSQPPPGISQPAAEAWKRNEAGNKAGCPSVGTVKPRAQGSGSTLSILSVLQRE